MLNGDMLKNFNSKLEKLGIDTEDDIGKPPSFWIGSGNHVLNMILTGDPHKFLPQGRITGIAGPSGAGKSFLMSNIARQAQEEGAFVLLLDSENASDGDFTTKIGVDVKNNFKRVQISTISELNNTVSSFVKEYEKEYGRGDDAPKVVILLDSLDMLMTDSEMDNFNKGELSADQGLRAKQMKAVLRSFVQIIKHLNIAVGIAIQPYQSKREQILQGEGAWMINNAIRFAFSHIVLLTKLKLKDSDTKEVSGITMKCQGFKTRFAKPFQTVSIEVPYDTGMSRFSGLLPVLKSLGVVEQRGSWYYTRDGEKFRSSQIEEIGDTLLASMEGSNYYVSVDDDKEEDVSGASKSEKDTMKKRVKRKLEAEKGQGMNSNDDF